MKRISVCTVFWVVLLAATTRAEQLRYEEDIVAVDGRFLKHASGMVDDVHTGLQWFPAPDRPVDFEAAGRWAAGLTVAGGRWRLPTVAELRTLHHTGDAVRNIVPMFKNSGYWIWAAGKDGDPARWVFGFSYGGEGWGGRPPEDGGRALAVRPRLPVP